MERIGIFFRLKPGTQEEYKKRHDEIWPEMLEALKKAGIRNYSIWNHETLLFSYLECDNFEEAQEILQHDEINLRWRNYMEDIIFIDRETGQKEFLMKRMFLLE